MNPRRTLLWLSLVLMVALLSASRVRAQVSDDLKTLKVGDTAKDVEFLPLEGKRVKLDQLAKDGPVVLVVLRGFPGYQCPICSRQVADLSRHAKDFVQLGAKVVFVYPGPAQDLKKRAEEFLRGSQLPKPLMLVLDPDYSLTNDLHLRWEAPAETAYPSTFVFDPQRVVKFRKVSLSHGDRAKTEDVLDVLRAMRAANATGQEIPLDRGTPVPLRKR